MHRFGLLAGLMMLLAFGAKLPGDETLGVKPRFTVSRKTTFLVSPLRKNGSIDYAAAINTQMSDGVTPQNIRRLDRRLIKTNYPPPSFRNWGFLFLTMTELFFSFPRISSTINI